MLDQAVIELRRAIELDPSNSTYHSNLAATLYDEHKLDEAIVEYRRAIELGSDNSMAHNDLGKALSQQGKHDEAMVELKRAVGLEPNDARIHNNVGDVLFDERKLNEAIVEYRRSIELDPRPPYYKRFGLNYPYFNLAKTLGALVPGGSLTEADIARLSEACASLATGHAIAPESPDVSPLMSEIDARLQGHARCPPG